MGILRAGNQEQAHAAEAGPSFLKREFFRSNPDELVGDPKEPLKVDEWLEQMEKTFEMLGIEDGSKGDLSILPTEGRCGSMVEVREGQCWWCMGGVCECFPGEVFIFSCEEEAEGAVLPA